jgi:hypothetical protein
LLGDADWLHFHSDSMKATPRRKMTVTSSLNDISKDQLGKAPLTMAINGQVLLRPPIPFLKQLADDMIEF